MSKVKYKKNIDNHIKFIHIALSHHADAIFFPELSLTSYEPELAYDLAINYQEDYL
jgi:predicted amidohydrolase